MSNLQIGPIKDFSLGIYDGPHATPPESEDGPIFLGIKNVTSDGRLDFTEIRHISEDDFHKWTKRVNPQMDDIVFSYEATLHRYAIIPEGFRGCLGRRMALIRPDTSKVLPRFLYYYFLTPEWRSIVESNIINGATVDRIPIKKFPEFEVKLPSLETQRKVVEMLGSYDDLIENNKRRIQLLEQAAIVIYREWFVHLRFPGHEHLEFIEGIPDGWERGTISDFFDTTSGGTPSRKNPEFFTGDINWVKTQELNDDYIFETDEKITEEAVKNSSAKIFPENTLLVSIYGGTNIGRTGILASSAASNQACVALFPIEGPANSFFAQLYFRENRELLINLAQGSAQTNISQQTIRNLPMVMPKAEIMDIFIGYVEPMFIQKRNLILQNVKLKQSRDMLLPKLMKGEISV